METSDIALSSLMQTIAKRLSAKKQGGKQKS